MHVVIVGGGAIGRLFGYYLAREGSQVTIVDTAPESVAALNNQGIEFMAVGETNPDSFARVPATAVGDGLQIKSCDLVLLTVKSSSTPAAARNIAHLVSEEVPLLSLQTGLGNIEVLEGILPENSVLAGFTFMSGANLGGGRVRHGGYGTTYIGELSGELSERLFLISELFQESGIPVRQVRRIQGRLWSKVIVYAAINPVSAILRVTNGCLVEQEESLSLMKQLVEEGCRVAEAWDVDLVYPDLWAELLTACSQSANNISPMLQDILNELPTEIDAQNGMLCRYGKEKGVDTPTHESLVRLIRLIEYWKPGSERRC